MSNLPDELKEFLKGVDKSKFNDEPFIKKVPKPWGYELIFTPEGLPYSGKILHIKEGKKLSLQIHDKKQETYWLASGRCNLLLENEKGEIVKIELEKGKGYTTIPGQRHRHEAITDCDVFEAAMPEGGNTYRLEDNYSRATETEEVRKDPNRGWNP